MNYVPMPAAESCGKAWLSAARTLFDEGAVNNMIVHIVDPISRSKEDDAILTEVDVFLRAHGAYPLSTVANTIFPESL